LKKATNQRFSIEIIFIKGYTYITYIKLLRASPLYRLRRAQKDGHNMDTLSVKKTHTVYRDGDRVLKIYCEDYPKGDVFAEAHNQALIEQSGIKAPVVYGVREVDGKWAIEMQYISADNLQALLDAHPEKEDEYLKLFVNLHMGVYAFKLTSLYRLVDKINLAISKTDLLATVKYDLHTRSDDRRKHTRVCHGNFIPENVKVGKDGKCFILDWSRATQGNPQIDIANTYLLLKLDGKEGFAEKYLALMAEKSVYTREDIVRWLPVVAAQRLVGCREEERAFLLGIIGVKDIK